MCAQTRQTRQKQLVCDAVEARCDHPTAEQIYDDVRERDEKISRATVYRNLGALADAGAIQRVRLPGADRYDRLLGPHGHLVCRECGAVCDLSLPHNMALDEQVAADTGYEVDGHYTVFLGLCPDCRAKRE